MAQLISVPTLIVNTSEGALEAKLAAATDLISRAKEIIPDSYINWHDFARAALGGKP